MGLADAVLLLIVKLDSRVREWAAGGRARLPNAAAVVQSAQLVIVDPGAGKMVLLAQDVIELDHVPIRCLAGRIGEQGSLVVGDATQVGSVVGVERVHFLRHGANLGNLVVRELIARCWIVNHVRLGLQRLPGVVLHHDRGQPRTRRRSAGDDIAVRVVPQRLSHYAAEVAAEHRRCGNRGAAAVQPPVDLLISLEGSEEERLVFVDRAAQAKAVIPGPVLGFANALVIVGPGVGVEQFVMPIEEARSVQRVGSRLEVEGHHAAAGNAALSVQAASLRLELFDGFHARSAIHRVAADIGCARCAVNRVVLGEPLAAVHHRPIGGTDRRIARCDRHRKQLDKAAPSIDIQRQIVDDIRLHIGAH